MDALQNAICTIKSHLNTLLPISRLPHEVIATIFHWLSVIEPYCFRERPPWPLSTPERLGWIKATHVCSYWRQIGLETPSLWSTVAVDFNAASHACIWPKEILQRSKEAPLFIKCVSAPPRITAEMEPYLMPRERGRAGDELLSLVSKQTSRIRKMMLEDVAKDGAASYELYSQRAPLLEHVCFHAHPQGYPVASAVLAPSLFDHTAPILRTLSIKNCWFIWDSLQFPTLKCLEIDVQAVTTEHVRQTISRYPALNAAGYFSQSTDSMLACLSALPNLEELTIRHAIPLTPPTDSAPTSIALPRLRKLTLAASSSTACSWIIDRLDISTLKEVKIQYGGGLDEYSSTLPFIKSFLASRDISVFSISNDAELVIRAWSTTSPEQNTINPTENPLLSVSWSLHQSDHAEASSALLDICAPFPLDSVSTVILHSASDSTRKIWTPVLIRALFSRCAKAENVRATGGACLPLLVALAPGPSLLFWREPEPPIFPKLRVLELEDPFGNAISDLLMVVKRRAAASLGLELLRFDAYSGVLEAEQRELEKHVREVIVRNTEDAEDICTLG
jgi:hypothetical protein